MGAKFTRRLAPPESRGPTRTAGNAVGGGRLNNIPRSPEWREPTTGPARKSPGRRDPLRKGLAQVRPRRKPRAKCERTPILLEAMRNGSVAAIVRKGQMPHHNRFGSRLWSDDPPLAAGDRPTPLNSHPGSDHYINSFHEMPYSRFRGFGGRQNAPFSSGQIRHGDDHDNANECDGEDHYSRRDRERTLRRR